MKDGQRTASILPERDLSSWITAQRSARAVLDPFTPHSFFLERERDASGTIVNSGVILLTNKECPWRCLMCDLWRHTLTITVPSGAIQQQIAFALERFDTLPTQLKLYNSGSFFDPAAIPPGDYDGIAKTISSIRRVIVECHPRLVGDRTIQFRDLLFGSLEVALGLETIHPTVLPRLNKKFTLGHFEDAAEFLRLEGIAMRAFVLVKPPFMTESEAVEWAVKSAEFAFSCCATAVSLIPTRPGNGALDRLSEAGEFDPPRLATLERALEGAISLRGGRAFADTWNIEQFSRCPICLEQRRGRLHEMNLAQHIPPPVACTSCGEE